MTPLGLGSVRLAPAPSWATISPRPSHLPWTARDPRRSFPIPLPAVRRTYEFIDRDGVAVRRTVEMTERGMYETIGLAPLRPGAIARAQRARP